MTQNERDIYQGIKLQMDYDRADYKREITQTILDRTSLSVQDAAIAAEQTLVGFEQLFAQHNINHAYSPEQLQQIKSGKKSIWQVQQEILTNLRNQA